MGNTVSPCFRSASKSYVKLILWDGTTRILTGKHIAGEIMFKHPDKMICHADSFFIGHPLPVLAIDDQLTPGQTYFVIPVERFACNVLTASSLAAFITSGSPSPTIFGQCQPFEYIKGSNGRVLIKVVPEFITRLLINGAKEENCCTSPIISTPELKKHYEQLVGSRDQPWSPNLETISEYKIRYSPCRFLGLEWKHIEGE